LLFYLKGPENLAAERRSSPPCHRSRGGANTFFDLATCRLPSVARDFLVRLGTYSHANRTERVRARADHRDGIRGLRQRYIEGNVHADAEPPCAASRFHRA
jgi:hypothetical protein